MFRFKLFSVLAIIAVASSAFAITDEEIFRSFAFSFLNCLFYKKRGRKLTMSKQHNKK